MLDLTEAFASFPVLETERCILRAATPDDAADIFRIQSDPRVTRYLGRQPMTSLDQAVQRIKSYRTTFSEQTGIIWAITRRGEQQVIGTCVFWNLVKPHFRAEIGYMLAPEWWRQGIVTEAASAALNFGFTTMGLHSVEAQTAPENAASRGVLEKLGFVLEGYFHEDYYNPVNECFSDTTVYSLLKSTWIKRTER